MKKIRVNYLGYGEDWHLGTLAEQGQQLLFEYSPEALQRGLELSPRHLKLRPEAYGDFPLYQHKLPGLVADCLPDGWGMLLMDRFFRQHGHKSTQEISALDRLAFIGRRSMGALGFEPPNPEELSPKALDLLTLAQEVKQVIQGEDTQVLEQLVRVGGSPQGARPKALVQCDPATGEMSTLDSAPGTPWLVKFPAQGEHPEVCALEQVYAEMAHLCGLKMPHTRFIELPGKLAAFAIERFDRANGQRIPMHTLAGVLHADFRVPSVDYQTLLRMTRLMTRSEAEVLKAFERCVFNVIFNNRDDHSKNFSYLLNPQGHWQLAPGYDLTYCEGPGGEHQMDIEGEGKTPGSTHLLALARRADLSEAACRSIIERMAEQALSFESAAKQYPIRATTRKAISKALNRNLSYLSRL
ncbi:MAG: type II toxin-antitoxin system HipA family toxin [Azovibrio sp.]